MKYLCVIFLKTLHKWFILSKLLLRIQRRSAGLPDHVVVPLSEHEVESISLTHGTGSSVGDLSGFISGELFTLISDSLTAGVPAGLLGGGVGIITGLTSLETKRARGSFSHDNVGLINQRLEKGLSNRVEGKSNGLNNNVKSFKLNINGIVKVSNLKLSSPGVSTDEMGEVFVVGFVVVINDQSDDLHNEKNKNADNPDSHPDFYEAVEEGVKDRESPSSHRDSPKDAH